jgi:hypothetical protein
MAKITVTTDEGEVIERWEDDADTIGDVTRQVNRQFLIAEFTAAITAAREKDGRNQAGYKL